MCENLGMIKKLGVVYDYARTVAGITNAPNQGREDVFVGLGKITLQ